MAEKGARARLEPLAFRMFAEGQTLDQISAALGVSRQSLSEWKSRTRRAGEELDEWDRAREQKRSRLDRLRTMFDESLDAFEEMSPLHRLDSKLMDALAKLGALIEKWEGMETKARKQALEDAVSAVAKESGKSGAPQISKETLDFIKEVVYGLAPSA